MTRDRSGPSAVGGSDARARPQPSDEALEEWLNGETISGITAHAGVLRVLVADDNKDAARTLAMLVKLWGHDARVAHDGSAAFQMATEFRPVSCW